MQSKELFERRIKREIAARKEAEQILEKKSLELYEANVRLKNLNAKLETQVEERTQKLVVSERRYKNLIDDAHDLIYVNNQEGTITFINKLTEKLFGYKKSDVIGKHFTHFIREDYRASAIEQIMKVIKSRSATTYIEFPSFKVGNEWVWLGQNIRFTYNEAGMMIEAMAIARDITQKKKEEEQLISQEIQLRSLIENMQAGILFQSKRQEILQINKFFCDFFEIKLPPHELIGKKTELVEQCVLDKLLDPESLFKRIKNTTTKLLRQELQLADNRYIKFDFIPIYSNGNYLGNLWQFIDMTTQKVLDMKIRNSEEKYRGVIENMDLGLVEVDNDGIITKAYDRYCKMVGYTEAELIGKKGQDLLVPEDQMEVVLHNRELREKGVNNVFEIEIYKKNKDRIWMLVSVAPYFNINGEKMGLLAIHFDISHIKRLQRELLEAKEIAEKAQEAEQQFLANMSHEIRTPLNAVIGMSHLLHDTNPTTEQREYLDMIQYSANLLNNLVTDILDFSKINAGAFELNEAEFDMSALLRTLHKTFELKTASKPVTVTLDMPEIEYLMLGDETLLNQVLYNLLGNAEKFTAEGNIQLSAEFKPGVENNITAILRVKDSGIGIAEDKLKFIFEEFSQENRETKLKYGGTGLGLAISKNIVDLLHGEIHVESEKGKGATFIVSIPLKTTNKPIVVEKEVKYVSNYIKSNVLVVEDNLMNQNYIGKILQKENVDYDIVNNGLEATEMVKKKRYNLIFMDISMPVMDGYEATIKIRNSANLNRETTIIALTASAISTKKNKAFEIGMNDYMTKPFTPYELKNILAKYLGENSSETISQQNTIQETEKDDVLDRETLNMFYDNDNEYALEMFNMFLNQFDAQFAELKSLVSSNNTEEAKRMVHKMKPTFSMVGAPALQTAFQQMEDSLRYNDKSAANANWQHILELIDTFMPAINAEKKRLEENL